MSLPAIEVSGLSKRYVLEHESQHDNLRDTLHHTARKLWRRFRWGTGFESEEFWALRDVSFAVQPGEVVGIIGRNGAGKSTLLKILSRISEPSAGRISIRGRVASLLEVGTGFHPDLTGRENIFLNGAILGMNRAEIRKKFDEIVAFAEVERFLDTPVKRYSSGMYVRLAFSVAAHLEPEILIVDEVLAVGDASFQKKCLGRMKAISSGEGRTILFVSHNLAAVRSLTDRCVYLQNGRLQVIAPTADVLDHYSRDLAPAKMSSLGRGIHTAILRTAMMDADGHETSVHDGRTTTHLEVDVEIDGTPMLILECYLQDGTGQKLAIYSPGHFSSCRLPTDAGRWRCQLELSIPPLASGVYFFDVAITRLDHGYDHYVPEAIMCEVYAPIMRPAAWEYKRDYQAGFFIMDGNTLPKLQVLPPA